MLTRLTGPHTRQAQKEACIGLVGGYFTLTLALSLKGEGILLSSGWLILN